MKAKSINLALQGGGAHGAFTWGVLDRLLDEHALNIEGISGTSAGAMNALMLAQGWCEGQHAGAQQELAEFWHRIAEKSPARWLKHYASGAVADSLSNNINNTLMQISRRGSPYNSNPMDINPLRDLVRDMVDFPMLRNQKIFKIFIVATEVRTGKIKIFREWELDENRVLASACLPHIHKAIEVDGEFYWDGGFSGNPAIYPLIQECDAKDILIVLLQQLRRDELPKDNASINERIGEFSFGNSFMREMRAIVDAHEKVKSKSLLLGGGDRRMKKLNFHLIEPHQAIADMPQSSKLDTRLEFLLKLKALGRKEAESWLNKNLLRVGSESTLDLAKHFS